MSAILIKNENSNFDRLGIHYDFEIGDVCFGDISEYKPEWVWCMATLGYYPRITFIDKEETSIGGFYFKHARVQFATKDDAVLFSITFGEGV